MCVVSKLASNCDLTPRGVKQDTKALAVSGVIIYLLLLTNSMRHSVLCWFVEGDNPFRGYRLPFCFLSRNLYRGSDVMNK